VISEGQYKGVETAEFYRRLRIIVGLVLIVVGSLMAIWAFTNVYRIFTNPQQLEVFKRIVPDNPEMRVLDIEGREVVLPEGLFHFLAYVVGCLLLIIAGTIGGAIITGGANLMRFDIQRLERGFSKKIEGLKEKMEEIGETLKKKTE